MASTWNAGPGLTSKSTAIVSGSFVADEVTVASA